MIPYLSSSINHNNSGSYWNKNISIMLPATPLSSKTMKSLQLCESLGVSIFDKIFAFKFPPFVSGTFITNTRGVDYGSECILMRYAGCTWWVLYLCGPIPRSQPQQGCTIRHFLSFLEGWIKIKMLIWAHNEVLLSLQFMLRGRWWWLFVAWEFHPSDSHRCRCWMGSLSVNRFRRKMTPRSVNVLETSFLGNAPGQQQPAVVSVVLVKVETKARQNNGGESGLLKRPGEDRRRRWLNTWLLTNRPTSFEPRKIRRED